MVDNAFDTMHSCTQCILINNLFFSLSFSLKCSNKLKFEFLVFFVFDNQKCQAGFNPIQATMQHRTITVVFGQVFVKEMKILFLKK